MSRPRKLTPEQHRIVAERNLQYVRLRVEAAKHSPYQLAKEFGISEESMRQYICRHIQSAC
jgi:hypothetical protein